MSIKNIQKLKHFGIFQNHTNADAKDFGKYNLFYGWNGSGKSTLSDLFRCIEKKACLEKFPSQEFTITVDGGPTITQANISETNLNVYTFNHDFINENISWNQVVKSILLIDKDKIDDRIKLEELKKSRKTHMEAHEKEFEEIRKLTEAVSKFETESARHIKTSLQSIDTNDSYYLNYDKRRFKAFITSNINATGTDTSLLSEDKIIELTNAAKPDQKSPISFTPQTLNQEIFRKAKERLDNLLETRIVSKIIQRLADNGDIKSWVEAGLNLHKHHDKTQCEFCGNPITEERLKELEAHFNDDYKNFQNRLVSADSWLSDQHIQSPTLPATSEFYDEFKREYSEACTDLEKTIKQLNGEISAWHTALKEKIENPLQTNLTVAPISELLINSFNLAIKAIGSAVEKHNHKSKNFREETNKAKKQLELHYATTEIKSYGYHEKNNEIIIRAKNNESKKSIISNLSTQIMDLENSLSNEGLGAKQFNNSLRKFLGRSELSLSFNPSKRGYEILRNDSVLTEGNLSEGEKTAIAFVYFITKLKENNNKMEDTIVVVDDPVSSFDSNHLFHAYSFLRSNCEEANQLFVLTHNFTYFRLIRDWFDNVNRNRARKNKTQYALFYTIESSINPPRQSVYKDAHCSLTDYNSEYHYIFSKLHSYKDIPTLSREEAFLTANLARKLLESFFSFKFPKYRREFSQLMTRALADCKVTDETTKEKIYRFINKYSHSYVIEINEESSENLAGESRNVIGDIFTWLEEIDDTHYGEMLEVMTLPPN